MKRQTRVTYMDVSVFEEETSFQRAYDLLPEWRKEKISRMKYEKDRRLSLGAGYLLSRELKELGIGSGKMSLSPEGKPEHPEIHFNLSHSGKMAMCIISGSPCGCDIEKIREIDLKLAKRFFAASEDAHIRGSMNPETEFFRLWTLKESFIKATGEGLGRPLSSFEMSVGDEITVKGMEEWFFHEMRDIEGYMAACCTMEKSRPDILEIFFE